MVVLEEEAMGVQTVAIRTGMVTIKATSLLATPVLETILQPIPTGMNILGLELKSKFARRLSLLCFSKQHENSIFFPFITYLILNRLTHLKKWQRK